MFSLFGASCDQSASKLETKCLDGLVAWMPWAASIWDSWPSLTEKVWVTMKVTKLRELEVNLAVAL